ncbi:MAG TPA: hypothetical protein VHC96_14710 [Puia sp.]|nr:hypothetical protein [Puia sp.]
MKPNIIVALIGLLMAGTWAACGKSIPVDEDGLLITTRTDCYVSSFELLGTDYVSVRSGTATVDTTALKINVKVLFGTDLTHLYPQFTLAQDCKLTPKITGFVDLSDTLHPKQWTVISGNRKIQKTYSVVVSVQSR